jgi:hypothetical protein
MYISQKLLSFVQRYLLKRLCLEVVNIVTDTVRFFASILCNGNVRMHFFMSQWRTCSLRGNAKMVYHRKYSIVLVSANHWNFIGQLRNWANEKP